MKIRHICSIVKKERGCVGGGGGGGGEEAWRGHLYFQIDRIPPEVTKIIDPDFGRIISSQ